jgi:hypothetical protein
MRASYPLRSRKPEQGQALCNAENTCTHQKRNIRLKKKKLTHLEHPILYAVASRSKARHYAMQRTLAPTEAPHSMLLVAEGLIH